MINFHFKSVLNNKELANTHNDIFSFLEKHWGSEKIVSKGKITDASKLPRIECYDEDYKLIGLATYNPNQKTGKCELVSIDTEVLGQGVGTKLIKNVEEEAKKARCNKIWLVTTNDNMQAVNFYLKNGFKLIKVHLDALEVSRKLKPQIPIIGNRGIPLRDELELEKNI